MPFIDSWLSPTWLTWNKYSEGMLRTLEKQILSGIYFLSLLFTIITHYLFIYKFVVLFSGKDSL